jgi:hypothetical protein
VVKEGDDLPAAARYDVIMLRFAETIYRKREKWPPPALRRPLMDEYVTRLARGKWCGETAGCCPFKPHGCTAAGNARRRAAPMVRNGMKRPCNYVRNEQTFGAK